MRYRKLVGKDYVIGEFVTGAEAVAQAVKTNLKLLKGEWWENPNKGLPLFQNILGLTGQKENLVSAELLIQENILSTKGVKGIKNFKSELKNREFKLDCRVDTIFGEIDLEVSF